MPITRWRDTRPNDIINPSTNRISLGICCEIQTMGFHGFVDEENDPRYTIMQVDDRAEVHLAPKDASPEWLHDNIAHLRQSPSLCTEMRSDRDFSAMAQIPMSKLEPEPVTLLPRCLGEGYFHIHVKRGREFVYDGRPLATVGIRLLYEDEDSYDWADITHMTNGG